MTDSLSGYYPPVSFYFKVTVLGITGMNEGSFQEVSGMNVKIDPEEIKEGGVNGYSHRLPSRVKYENLVLKRGMVTDSPLILWARSAVESYTFVSTGVLLQLVDADDVPQAAWMFANAYPVALKMSDFKAMENAVAIETLELCYDYFTRLR